MDVRTVLSRSSASFWLTTLTLLAPCVRSLIGFGVAIIVVVIIAIVAIALGDKSKSGSSGGPPVRPSPLWILVRLALANLP